MMVATTEVRPTKIAHLKNIAEDRGEIVEDVPRGVLCGERNDRQLEPAGFVATGTLAR